MTPKDLQRTLKVLDEMEGIELALASLYKTCGEIYPEDQRFWTAISRQEEMHARSLGEISALVSQEPQAFEFGSAFDSIKIAHIKSIIDNHSDQVRNKEIARDKALIIARDIENSVLEVNYGGFLKTRNARFKAIMDILEKDTAIHKNLFADKVAKTVS